MKHENRLGVLLFLFDNLVAANDLIFCGNLSVGSDLLAQGFSSKDINFALAWLQELTKRNKSTRLVLKRLDNIFLEDRSIRLFNMRERNELGLEAIDFLLQLENLQILDPLTREMIIEMSLQLNLAELTLLEFKKIVGMIMFEHPNIDKVLFLIEKEDQINLVH